MYMTPLTQFELTNNLGLQAEFTKDHMFEKICLLAVGYFCISTELRFLNGSESVRNNKMREAEYWHA
jgi:hypothetical protein